MSWFQPHSHILLVYHIQMIHLKQTNKQTQLKNTINNKTMNVENARFHFCSSSSVSANEGLKSWGQKYEYFNKFAPMNLVSNCNQSIY